MSFLPLLKAPTQHGDPSSLKVASYIDHKLGRTPIPTPAHLARVLYFPHYSNITTHLPIYDATNLYHKAVGDSYLGSSEFTMRICFMQKPRADGLNAKASWLVDFFPEEKGEKEVRLSRMDMGSRGEEVILKSATSPPHACTISFSNTATSQPSSLSISISYPIPPSTRSADTIFHPYFTLLPSQQNFSTQSMLQWQIHPIEFGLRCYILVDLSPAATTGIRAIYHHIGLAPSLQTGYSEGVLLMPEDEDSLRLEGAVVASVLWMLGELRESGTGEKSRTRSGRLFRKVVMRSKTRVA